MNPRAILLKFLSLLSLLLATSGAIGEHSDRSIYKDANGNPLPFQSESEIQEFLLTAAVIRTEPLEHGTSKNLKVLLKKGKTEVLAVFRHIEIKRVEETLPGKSFIFRDDYRFECAAYELSRRLGLDSIPPVVERAVEGQSGSLQLWMVDMVTESERRRTAKPSVSREELEYQWQLMTIFDNLIYNNDRHQDNYLYDSDGRIWMIDHTRSFDDDHDLPYPAGIRYCDQRLWKALRSLEPDTIRRLLGPYLDKEQLEALIERRRLLIEYVTGLIQEKGRDQVIVRPPPRDSQGIDY